MARRLSHVGMLCCPVSPRDRLICDEIKAAVALDSDANLCRTALYHLAIHVLGARAVDVETFRLQRFRGSRRRGAAVASVMNKGKRGGER